MRAALPTLLLAATAGVAAPTSAAALDVAAVTVDGTHRPYAPETYLSINGEGADAETVGLHVEGDRLLVTANGPVRPREACRAVTPTAASCPLGSVRAWLGDGDDRLDATALPATTLLDADGGAGADVLLAGPGGKRLTGGPGDDRLDGGDGPDSLAGGPGSDRVSGGPGDDGLDQESTGAGADVLDGGPGLDQLRELAAGPLRVDLAAGTYAAPGATATVTAMETVSGTDADDVLLGTDGPDTLSGAGGRDLVDGRAGDDVLVGGTGPSTLLGGAGDDRLDDLLGQAQVDGGPGDDFLQGRLDGGDTCGDGEDLITASPRLAARLACEARLVGAGDVGIALPLAVPARARSVRVVVQRVPGARGRHLELAAGRRGGRPVRVRLSSRTTRTVRVPVRGARTGRTVQLRATVPFPRTAQLPTRRAAFRIRRDG